MRLIKIYSILTVLVALAYIGLSFFKNSDYKEEVENIPVEKGEVAPFEKWRDILIGKWRFSGERKYPTKIQVFDGTVEYFEDSTYHKLINYSLYEDLLVGEVSKDNDFLAIKGGTTDKGILTMYRNGENGRKQWIEQSTGCYDHFTYEEEDDENLCQVKGLSHWLKPISINGSYTYYRDYITYYEPLLFTKDKIILREKVLGNDDYNYFTYERIIEN